MRLKKAAKLFLVMVLFFLAIGFLKTDIYAAENLLPIPSVDITVGTAEDPKEVTDSLQLLFMLTIISLAPFIIIMLTSFTRIIIVLHFVRSALGTQQMPPNQILIGLALFLTFFIMNGPITEINENALKPYSAGQITQQEAIDRGMAPIRTFMISQVADKDVALFSKLAENSGINYETMPREELPNMVLIPAFIIGELTKGFIFGVIIYMPFIVVDMVVASTLMAMGMMMLPPAMISLPFKILLFVLLDGWNLIIDLLFFTFR